MSINSEARDAAQAAGQLKYSTGQPCKHGHTAQRWTSTGGCLECVTRKVIKANAVRGVMQLQLPVSAALTTEQRVALTNYLGRCAGAYHEAQGMVFPLNPSALAWGEMEGRPFTECPF